MARVLDELAEFERYQEEIMPILRQAIAENWTAERIWSHPKTQAMMAARAVTIGLMDKDTARALAAIKDVADRTSGKPTEKKEIKHTLEKLSDNELDALLTTKLRDMSDDDSDSLN
jgi:hypothetical protein